MMRREDGDAAHARANRPRDFIRYLDDDGVRWEVWERDARRDPGSHGHSCLIFVSDDAIRRVWLYPVAWRELSPEGLIALSWGR